MSGASALPPRGEDLFDPVRNALAGVGAIQSASQQFIVIGMVVTNSGGNRKGQCLLVELPTRLCPANTPASSLRGMPGDLFGRERWTTGKEHPNLLRHASHQGPILFTPPLGPACTSGRPLVGILRRFPLGFLQRGLLHQNALPFVALS